LLRLPSIVLPVLVATLQLASSRISDAGMDEGIVINICCLLPFVNVYQEYWRDNQSSELCIRLRFAYPGNLLKKFKSVSVKCQTAPAVLHIKGRSGGRITTSWRAFQLYADLSRVSGSSYRWVQSSKS
jgi:hypothetical protein